jgi:YHS domain-containing protein
MEQHLGRRLEDWEQIDHIDNDFTNNNLDNLQILSVADNNRKSAKPAEEVTFTCPVCGTIITKSASKAKHNRKQGKAGPFCSRSCAGKFSAMRQHHGIELD